ncbi:MAG: hypothetical protein V3V78_01500 [Candidatus Woesearchaeota archaeon]
MRIIIIGMIILSVLLISGCQKDMPPEELMKCDVDEDCIVVEERGCCGCPAVINKQHEDWWNNRKVVESCPGRECELCAQYYEPARCEDNVCTANYGRNPCDNEGYCLSSETQECEVWHVNAGAGICGCSESESWCAKLK